MYLDTSTDRNNSVACKGSQRVITTYQSKLSYVNTCETKDFENNDYESSNLNYPSILNYQKM